MKKACGIILIIIGVILMLAEIALKIKGSVSFVIGSADGPTSVFLAGKTGGSPEIAGITIGIVLIICGGALLKIRKQH